MRRARLLLAGMLELPIRGGALLLAITGREQSATEALLRGYVLGGASRWRVGRSVRFLGPPGRILLGRNVCLYGTTVIDANGPSGSVRIGHRSHVDHFGVLYGQGGLVIGDDCALAAGTIIYTQTNADAAHDGTPVARQPTRYAAVRIGDGCWLGAGVRIVPGVTLGTGVHVGAGAVVTASLKDHVLAAGVPARVVRARDDAARPTTESRG